VAPALIDDITEPDLDLMPACLAPDRQSDIGLEIVAAGRQIRVHRSWAVVANPSATARSLLRMPLPSIPKRSNCRQPLTAHASSGGADSPSGLETDERNGGAT
jgi:hypothetical protein